MRLAFLLLALLYFFSSASALLPLHQEPKAALLVQSEQQQQFANTPKFVVPNCDDDNHTTEDNCHPNPMSGLYSCCARIRPSSTATKTAKKTAGHSAASSLSSTSSAPREMQKINNGLDRDRDRPAFVQQPPQPDPIAAADNRVRLLTYNFFLRPPFISDYKGDSKDERLSLFISDILPRYDVLVMQETFSGYSSRVSHLERAARRAGYHSAVRGPRGSVTSGHLLDAGLLVLSRWPVTARATLTFSHGVTVDRLASKGATYSLHESPTRQGQRLHVVNSHLQASYSTAPRIDDPSVICRTQQVHELARFVAENVGVHWPRAAELAAEREAAASLAAENVAVEPALPVSPASPNLASAVSPLPVSPDLVIPAPPANATTGLTPYDVVLVCGDLNINSMQPGGAEYAQLMTLMTCGGRFRVTDLLREQGREDYTQIPWVWLSQKRHALTPDIYAKEGGRLDYVLLLEPMAEMSHAIETHIDPCLVEGAAFSQLSDHMGVAAHITFPQ
ncbi:Endonuclease/exonuclease/phosphatase [Blastocladiella britannica]|nr:Endonuclease/exonuclease/phosphatase [Blastocladiella britannica]